MYKVYGHIFPNGKIYIGITKNSLEERFQKDGSGYNNQELMRKAIQKYGWNNIEHELIADNLTKEEACNFEKLLISKLQTNKPEYGYNLTLGGDGVSIYDNTKIIELWKNGKTHFEIQKEIGCSLHTISRALSSLEIPQIERAIKTKINHGFCFEYSLINELWQDGHTVEEICDKIGCGVLTVYRAIRANPNISKEERIARANQQRKGKNSHPKKVDQLSLTGEYIQTFNKIKDAANAVGLKGGETISRACRGNIKTAAGYKWRFHNE